MMNNICRITHISDTHGFHESLTLKGGDILIHSGDIFDLEKKISIKKILDWFEGTPYEFKIIVLGNHDNQEFLEYKLPEKVLLLNNKFINIHNISFYGLTGTLKKNYTPYSFGQLSDTDIANELQDIGCDVFITHGPPKDILDNKLGESVGSVSLLEYVKKHKPKYHLFGHAHHSRGTISNGLTTFSNASIVKKLFTKTLGGIPFDFTL
jgi:Icc-related predicted phosphoesterase